MRAFFITVDNLPPAGRRARAESCRSFWGSKWIVLPNPVYGSWERACYLGLDRREPGDEGRILERKREALEGLPDRQGS